MIAERPLNELTQDAIRILYRELGVVETVRFLRQFTGGYGDYTAEREALLGGREPLHRNDAPDAPLHQPAFPALSERAKPITERASRSRSSRLSMTAPVTATRTLSEKASAASESSTISPSISP